MGRRSRASLLGCIDAPKEVPVRPRPTGDAVFADGVYLVPWVEDGAVRGARLGATGEDADVFTIDAGPATSVAVTTDGTRFLAVFDRAEDASSSDLLGRSSRSI
jgi:hypothetical protein